MLKSQKGFTLIELVMVIVIIGILAAVAIPKYISLSSAASDGTARGVLGTLRSTNAMLYAQNSVGGNTATYTFGDIANGANLQGVTFATANTTFLLTVGNNTYVFTLTPTPQAPTTMGTIAAATATW